MGLRVVNPGGFATVQDAGRPGYRGRGVPTGGAFDLASFALANALVGNLPDSAAVELTAFGGIFDAEIPLALALSGAPMPARIELPDGTTRPLAIPQATSLPRGGRLVVGAAPIGLRTYLAVRGGWRTPLVLGSRSTESPLRAGDLLPAEPGTTPTRRVGAMDRSPLASGPIRVLDGPDAARLDPAAWDGAAVRVGSAADRMGLRLEGPAWPVADEPDRLSAPVAPGAIQVAGGRLMILGVAAGTMGGYPHVAHVVAADLDRLAQVRPGDAIAFLRVSPAEARRIDREERRRRRAMGLRVATLARDGQ